MGDTIAILPELSFRQQIVELATHISHSLPTASDAAASREYILGVEAALGPAPAPAAAGAEGAEVKPQEEEIPKDKAREVVKGLVGKVAEGRGALEGQKEADVESSHLLLQHVISTSLPAGESEQAVKHVIEAVRKGAEANAAAGRGARVEVAARILNNTYNALPVTSALRPSVLLTLLTLLARFTDLSVLPLPLPKLSAALAAWSLSNPDKLAWLRAARDVYIGAGQYGIAADLAELALRTVADAETRADTAEDVVVGMLLDEKRWDLGVLDEQARGALKGEAGEVVRLLEGEKGGEEVGAWVEKNAKWIEAKGIPRLTPTLISQKARLLTLARLFAASPSRTLGFSAIAPALGISADEVEEYVFDGCAAGLFVARISQPTESVRVISVSKAGAVLRSGAGEGQGQGKGEWELLERRLGEWRRAVQDARRVVADAEGAAGGMGLGLPQGSGHGLGHGYGQGQGQGGGQGQGQRGGRGQKREPREGQQGQQQQQQQQTPAEGVAA